MIKDLYPISPDSQVWATGNVLPEEVRHGHVSQFLITFL